MRSKAAARQQERAEPTTEAREPGHFELPQGYRDYYGLSVQRKATSDAPDEEQIQEGARVGTSGPSEPLPFVAQIQRSFGSHDVSRVQAHTGADAAEGARAMGAEAFASGQHVAFGATPSLHTAAHEAAHVVQQRSGVQLKGGVGEAGDSYERHADAVADQVVAGGSAQRLLDEVASPSASPTAGVQRLQSQVFANDQSVVNINTLDKGTCEKLIEALRKDEKTAKIGRIKYTFDDGDLEKLEARVLVAPEAKRAKAGAKKLSAAQEKARSTPTHGRVLDDETKAKDEQEWNQITALIEKTLSAALAEKPELFVFSLGTSGVDLQSCPPFAHKAAQDKKRVAIVNVDSMPFDNSQHQAAEKDLKLWCLVTHFPLGERQTRDDIGTQSHAEIEENTMAKLLMAKVVQACQTVKSTGGTAVVINAVGPANYPAFEAFKPEQVLPTFIAAHYDKGREGDTSSVVKDPHQYPYRGGTEAVDKADEKGLSIGLKDIELHHL